MDSFRRVGRKGTIEDYAEYLASFVQLRFKRRRVTIIAIGSGLAMVVRMCQRYPEIAKKVDQIVSVGGWLHHDDWLADKQSQAVAAILAKMLAAPVIGRLAGAYWLRAGLFNLLHQAGEALYQLCSLDPLLAGPTSLPAAERYRQPDAAAQWRLVAEGLQLDACQKRLAIPAYCLVDRLPLLVNNQVAEQHFRVVFEAPTFQVVGFSQLAATELLTPKLRRLLRS
jgi:hypothetical protein